MGETTILCALIYDEYYKVFLMTSDKWKGYGLPGGKPQENETEEETLHREVKEETGIDITDLMKAKEIIQPPTDDIDGETTFIVKPYFARALSTEIDPNSEVGEGSGWFTLREARELPLLGPIRKTLESYIRIFGKR